MYKILHLISVMCVCSLTYAQQSNDISNSFSRRNMFEDDNADEINQTLQQIEILRKNLRFIHSKTFALKISTGNISAIMHVELIAFLVTVLQHTPIILLKSMQNGLEKLPNTQTQFFNNICKKAKPVIHNYLNDTIALSRNNAQNGYVELMQHFLLQIFDHIYVEEIHMLKTLRMKTLNGIQTGIGISSRPYKKLFMMLSQSCNFLLLSDFMNKGFIRAQFGIADLYVSINYLRSLMMQNTIPNTKDISRKETRVMYTHLPMNGHAEKYMFLSLSKTLSIADVGILFHMRNDSYKIDFNKFTVRLLKRAKISLNKEGKSYSIEGNMLICRNFLLIDSLEGFILSKPLSGSELSIFQNIVSDAKSVFNKIYRVAGVHIIISGTLITIDTDGNFNINVHM